MRTLPNGRRTGLVTSGTARGQFLGNSAGDARDENEAGIPLDLRDALAAHDVSDEHLWAASEVAIWAAGAPAEQRRAFVCLVVALLETLEAGGTYLPMANSVDAGDSEPLLQMLRRLGVSDADQRAASSLCTALVAGAGHAAFSALVGGPGSRRPFILSDGALYTERHWVQEERLVDALQARLTARIDAFASDSDVNLAISASDARPAGPRLSDEQRAAIRAALTNPLTIITGGPGTGKTSTMVGLLHALALLGIPSEAVALAAPTGRAAQRMKEAVEAAAATTATTTSTDVRSEVQESQLSPPRNATTLHRLLGIRGGRWRVLEADVPEYYADWPLPHRVVVVDEASMIDLDLMERLVAATGPNTRLVLLGDADQLPSVRVGAVFRDLVTAAPLVTCRLTRSHRMDPGDPAGAEILRLASAVNAGPPLPLPPPPARAADLAFRGFEQLAPGHLEAFLDRWYGEILSAESSFPLAWDRIHVVDATHRIAPDEALSTLMRTIAASRILCVTREAGRTTSARALNLLMHGRVLAAAVTRGAVDPAAVNPFLPGEPVIVQRNDYARGLANGDVGVIVRIRGTRGEGLGVAFAEGGGFMVHALEDIVHVLALAFALTIHKAQGSEFERVALMLPEVDVPLLTREIIYTALTRARTGVVVVGDPDFLARAAARPLVRTSGIRTKLAQRGVSR